MENSAKTEAPRIARVLVAAVDDGHFCIHLDWVEAVYQRDDATLHAVKDADGASRSFLIHRGQPAIVVDLREAFGLSELLGATERAAFMVVRTGSILLAVQVDACVGVRDLDLTAKAPVATNLLRDGGLSVGHMVEIDGKVHGLVEPSRILSGTFRDQLEPFLVEAQAFRDRQTKLRELADELRRDPTITGLKTYGRLARRNGRTRAATAARLVLKAVQDAEQLTNGSLPEGGDLAADTLVSDLVALSVRRQTGEVVLQLATGDTGRIYLDLGRIADAFHAGEWGRGAFKRLLAAREGSYHFAATDAAVQPQRIEDAAQWLLVDALEQLSEERRTRQR